MYRASIRRGRGEDVERWGDPRTKRRRHFVPDRVARRETDVARWDSIREEGGRENDVARREVDVARRWDPSRARNSIRRREDDVARNSIRQQGQRKQDSTRKRLKTYRDEDVTGKTLLHLPEDLILQIFMKIEILDLIFTIPQVCSSWYKLSKNPLLYRSVVIGAHDHPFISNNPYWRHVPKSKPRPRPLVNSVKVAVDRSCGRLVEFSCGNMRDFRIHDIRYILARPLNTLKSLRLGVCILVHPRKLIDLVKNIHSLEELYLSHPFVTVEGIKQISSGCPKLKFFSLGTFMHNCQERASAIAHTMPSLQRLYLYENGLTNTDVKALLNGCPCLEYFYAKGFSNFQGDLLIRDCGNRINSIQILAEDAQEFGQEYEFHLKTTTDKHAYTQVGDYTLPLYNAPFKDIEVMRYR